MVIFMIKAVVIGGDKRQLYLAGALERAGIEVTLGALVRRAGEKSAENTQGYSALPTEKIKECDMLILPTPVSRDGETLFAPLTDDNIKLSDIFAAAKGKRVFGGAAGEKVKAAADIFGIKIEDIMEMERIAAALAVATAEGAIAIAVENHEGALFASECLITGYGRIGKLLAVRLKALGANVTVTARKEADFAAAETAGFDVVHTENFTEAVKKADIIFNTVPSVIFDTNALSLIKKDTLIVDLASSPGGLDHKTAEIMGIKSIWALSIPGKTAPRFAGEKTAEEILRRCAEKEVRR